MVFGVFVLFEVVVYLEWVGLIWVNGVVCGCFWVCVLGIDLVEVLDWLVIGLEFDVCSLENNFG